MDTEHKAEAWAGLRVNRSAAMKDAADRQMATVQHLRDCSACKPGQCAVPDACRKPEAPAGWNTLDKLLIAAAVLLAVAAAVILAVVPR